MTPMTMINFGNPLDKLKDTFADRDAGMSVIKVQLSVGCVDRAPASLLPSLQRLADSADTESAEGLAQLLADSSLQLLRRTPDWTASTGDCTFFREGKEEQAERAFNRLANAEAAKFDEPPPTAKDAKAAKGAATLAVVSLVACVYGDHSEACGPALAGSEPLTRESLTTLAGLADDGVVAAELFWSPDEPDEVLERIDLIESWPELMAL